LRGILAQRLFQYRPEHVRDRPEVGSVDIDRVESATSDVELISEAYVDIGDFAFSSASRRPGCQSFEELFGGDEKMSDGLFDSRELLLWLLFCQQ
jgi:hypothetical protein